MSKRSAVFLVFAVWPTAPIGERWDAAPRPEGAWSSVMALTPSGILVGFDEEGSEIGHVEIDISGTSPFAPIRLVSGTSFAVQDALTGRAVVGDVATGVASVLDVPGGDILIPVGGAPSLVVAGGSASGVITLIDVASSSVSHWAVAHVVDEVTLFDGALGSEHGSVVALRYVDSDWSLLISPRNDEPPLVIEGRAVAVSAKAVITEIRDIPVSRITGMSPAADLLDTVDIPWSRAYVGADDGTVMAVTNEGLVVRIAADGSAFTELGRTQMNEGGLPVLGIDAANERLIVTYDTAIEVIDIQDGSSVAVFDYEGSTPSFPIDGTARCGRFEFPYSPSRPVVAVDLVTGSTVEVELAADGPGHFKHVTHESRDGCTIIVDEGELGTALVHDEVVTPLPPDVEVLAMSPDGESLVIYGRGPFPRLVDSDDPLAAGIVLQVNSFEFAFG